MTLDHKIRIIVHTLSGIKREQAILDLLTHPETIAPRLKATLCMLNRWKRLPKFSYR